MDCKVCGKGDDKRPTIFKSEEYCCEAHRQILAKEKAGTEVALEVSE